jgi:hypothetical protein
VCVSVCEGNREDDTDAIRIIVVVGIVRNAMAVFTNVCKKTHFRLTRLIFGVHTRGGK